tara:strand:+ start:755 stop:3166 length:2412 start_codon:yes stop_codon:yes gene_type:complete
MTSSYRNPDPNRMGSTNYLSTEADLSEAVNKQIDANIADTREFYDQMVELEKLRFEQRDKQLSLVADLVQTSIPLIQKINKANQKRNEMTPLVSLLFDSVNGKPNELDKTKDDIDDAVKVAQHSNDLSEAEAKRQSEKATNTEDKLIAADAARIFAQGSFVVNDQLNSINHAKNFSKNFGMLMSGILKDDQFASLDNQVMDDASTRDEASDHYDQKLAIVYQTYDAQRDQLGLPNLSKGQLYKHLAPVILEHKQSALKKWEETQDRLIEQNKILRDNTEIADMIRNKETVVKDVTRWLSDRKEYYETRGTKKSIASLRAFQDMTGILQKQIDNDFAQIDAAHIANLLNADFTFPGGTMKLGDERAPIGAQGMADTLGRAMQKKSSDSLDAENQQNRIGIIQWEKDGHPQFVEELNKITDPIKRADEVDKYLLEFRQRFRIESEEQDPEYIKRFINREEYSDDAIVIEIRSRRRNNLPITQSMIDQIADPDLRDEQSKYVNTPELGAFTEDEVQDLETEKIPTLVRDAKQLSDLSKAKTDKFLVARDNAKEYVTARFKELVVGGQSRTTALTNALKEAKDFLADGTFDKEEILPIDTQATKDLQATMKAIGTDPSLIYSSEEWAGEAPHLAIAREYIRTGGKSAYPSYYMRFNFIKDADGAYLTPEEIFETRVNKVDKKEAKVEEIPERKELDNVDDQNKLLNKNNPTKTLEVSSKNNNIEWMIKTKPSVSGLNAEMFIRQLEMNIQNQHSITGIGQEQYKKTTLSTEDNNKLFEAVPELKEAPFLHPNTLSTEAINAMLKLNI